MKIIKEEIKLAKGFKQMLPVRLVQQILNTGLGESCQIALFSTQ